VAAARPLSWVRWLRVRLAGAIHGGPALIWIAGFLALGGYAAASTFSSVLWSGATARGVEQGGLVYFRYHGQEYVVDRTSRFTSTTVYFDPSDPAHTAVLDDLYNRIVSVSLVAVPFLIALAILAWDLRRRRIIRRQAKAPAERSFGDGLDLDVVRRLNATRRGRA
jgi:hypothetical protein